MRRQPLQSFIYREGYNDSLDPLSGNTTTSAQGSCNSFILGDGINRPFKGYYSQGTNSGSRIAVQLGSSWGGLMDYTNVTASGSFIKDALNSLYAIGAGKLSYEGTKIEQGTGTFSVPDTDFNTTTNVITEVGHGLTTGQPVLISSNVGLITVSGTALTATTSYYAIVLSSSTFKLAYTYTAAMAGTPVIDFTAVAAGNVTFSYGNDLTASTVLQVATVATNTNWYSYYDQAGLGQSDAPEVTVPVTPGTGYTGLINGAISFKIAAIRDRSQTGQDISSTGPIPVKGIASTTSAVVVPVNQTVKITFPTAQSGQTHWAVFATKQGFGGTGVFLRIGYRTSSATDATWIWAISEATVAAGGGATRTLEFDFQDGDLYPEEAWILDYQPPPGTHFLRLENCGIVLGCYDGTVCAVSLPNFLESYDPFHLLYLPEPVTAVLHRLTDDFAYVAGRNSIHAIQYVGYRGDDLPSATLTTISPDVGIAKQCNWCQASNTIVAFLEGKGLVRMSNGGNGQVLIDYEFGKEVAWLTKDWTTDTVVTWNPSTQSVVAGYGNVSVSYCFETQVWGNPVYNSDAGITGDWLSGIPSRGSLIVSLNNSGTHTAYAYDNNTSTTRMPISTISRWQSAVQGARSNNLYELESGVRVGTNGEPIIMGVHTNLFRTFYRTVAMTASSNVVTASSAIFNDTYTGKWIAMFGTGIGSQSMSIDTGTDIITIASTAGMIAGQAITVSTDGGVLPSPLVQGTIYYVIILSSTTIKLATTYANALAGTAINLTGGISPPFFVDINFLIGKLTYATTTTCTLTTISGASLSPQNSVSGMYALIGNYFRQVTPQRDAEEHLLNMRPAIQNCRSFCVSVYQPTDAITGALFSSTVFGTASDSSVVRVT